MQLTTDGCELLRSPGVDPNVNGYFLEAPCAAGRSSQHTRPGLDSMGGKIAHASQVSTYERASAAGLCAPGKKFKHSNLGKLGCPAESAPSHTPRFSSMPLPHRFTRPRALPQTIRCDCCLHIDTAAPDSSVPSLHTYTCRPGLLGWRLPNRTHRVQPPIKSRTATPAPMRREQNI